MISRPDKYTASQVGWARSVAKRGVRAYSIRTHILIYLAQITSLYVQGFEPLKITRVRPMDIKMFDRDADGYTACT